LCNIFLREEDGSRPVFGRYKKQQFDPHWNDHLLFYEYFHGDLGAGLGASHQTGWTGLVGKLLQQLGEYHSAGAERITINTTVEKLLNAAGIHENKE
jgi:hypothetical protein